MTTELENCAAIGKRWQIGPYRFEHQPNGRWGCDAHGHGVGNSRTPVTAFFGLRRWLKEPSRPCETP